MSIALKSTLPCSIDEDIQLHAAWKGHLSGLVGEKMIRGKSTPYLYLLRAGETEGDYYVTFLDADLSVRHQPFTITTTPQGWCYENGSPGGPFTQASIDDVVHLIMHCHKEQPIAFLG